MRLIREHFYSYRGLVVLSLAVVFTALYLVQVQYQSRRLQTALDRTALETRKLAQENERLSVEKRSQSTPQRIEHLARNLWKMQMPTPEHTQYLRVPEKIKQPEATQSVEGLKP